MGYKQLLYAVYGGLGDNSPPLVAWIKFQRRNGQQTIIAPRAWTLC